MPVGAETATEIPTLRSLFALIASLLFVGPVGANVTIVISGSGSTSNSSPSSGQAFTLTSTGTVLFKVYADTSTDVGRITLTGSGTVDLLIGNSGGFPTDPGTPFFSSPLARAWNGLALSSFSGSVRVAGRIARDLTQTLAATQVYRLQVEHDAEGVITATGVDQMCPGDATDVSNGCTVLTGQGANGREVWICVTPANSSTPLSFGTEFRYVITPRASAGVTDLRSDQTGQSTAPNVDDYTYMIDTMCD